MTRSARDQIQVKAGNDMYTALSGVACLVVLLGILALVVQSKAVFEDSLFFPSGANAASAR
jgi:hypothetical protein